MIESVRSFFKRNSKRIFGYGAGISIVCVLMLAAVPKYQDNIIIYPTSASLNVVDNLEGELLDGKVVIGTPKKIKENEEKVVHVILSTDKEFNDLFSSLPKEYKTQGANVLVSNRMQATLKSQFFDVSTSIPEIQAVGNGDSIKWDWSIKPKPRVSGDSRLTFTLSALLVVQGEPTAKVLKTYTRNVYVEVSTTSKVWTFMKENMAWLWAPVTLIAGWGYAIVFRRNKKSKANNASNNGN